MLNTRIYLPASLAVSLLAACSSVPYETPAEPRPAPVLIKPAAPVQPPVVSAPPAVVTKKGGAFYKDDGPGDNAPPDLDAIPDAQPRREPIRPANTRPYEALGQTFVPMKELQPFSQTGIGSWYGKKFHGARTASGERYDMYAMSAAHPTLPLPSYARVSNLENGKSVVVRINDRGPFLHNRIIDLSYTAAHKLGYTNKGSARLQVDAITADEIDNGRYARAPASTPAAPVATVAQERRPDPLESLVVASAPASAAEPQPESTPSVASKGIFLQLGAFSSSANAESFRDYVQSELKWLKQAVQAHFVGDKYRLRVGPFNDASEARGVAERIASAIRIKPFLVQ